MTINLTETSALDKKIKLEHTPVTRKIDNFVTKSTKKSLKEKYD